MSPLRPRPSAAAGPPRGYRIFAALAAAVGIAAITVLVGPAAASAAVLGSAGSATQPVAAPAEGTRPPVMIVLDASGSMNADDAPGSRIEAAKKAVTGLLSQMPADVKVGLQVFGSRTGSSDADKAAGCKDIVTLAKVGPLNKPSLTGMVAKIKASGYTPIATALQEAAKALPAEGPRSIMLVSDGEETCAPPEPCDVAKQLKQQGIDLTVHTIGFKVDDVARGQLSCIAAATGGSYADADDAAQLEQKLDTGFQRAAQKYSPKGTSVHGTPRPAADSPVLAPGQYLDKLEAGPAFQGKKAKYYRVPLTDGMTPRASASVIGKNSADNTGLDVGITWVNQDGADCFHGGFDVQIGSSGLAPITTVVADSIQYGDKWPQECRGSNTVYLVVWRAGHHAESTELPVEIIVRQEPAAVTKGLPGPAGKTPLPKAPITVPRRAATTGGPDLNSAPELKPGITYTDSITTTENRFYKVRVRWGQQLAVHLVPTKVNANAQQIAYASVHLLNPMRVDLGPFLSEPGKGTGSWGYETVYPLSASTPYPARYTNRNSTKSEVQRYALDGYYYVQLAMQEPTYAGKPGFTEPFTITVATPGTVEPGPIYQAPRSTGGADADRRGPAASSTPRNGSNGTATTGAASASAASASAVTTSAATTDIASAAGSAGGSAEAGSTTTVDTGAASTAGSDVATGLSVGSSSPAPASAGSSSPSVVGAADTAGGSGFPPWLWGLIAGLVVLGGGAVATVVRGRRNRRSVTGTPNHWNDVNGPGPSGN